MVLARGGRHLLRDVQCLSGRWIKYLSFFLVFKTVQEDGLAINSTETYVLFERSPHGGSLLKEIEGQRVVI